MAFGYEYLMVYLPEVNSESFLLFVHNPAGSSKLRDYSSGTEKGVGQPPWPVVRAATVSDETRFAEGAHIVSGEDGNRYGHLLKPGESYPNGITPLQAQALLRADVGWAEAAVNRLVTVALTQGRFDALVDFTFNVGAGTLSQSSALRALNAGDYAAVPASLELYDIAGGKVCEPLEQRRVREAALWNEAA